MHTMGELGTAPTRDGRALHYRSRGEGGPTVVFEAGMGSPGAAWGGVHPAVSAHTRSVVYDRAGLGSSPVDPTGRSLGRLVADLTDLLEHLDAGPYVLVAHSYGGPIVRVLASERPDLVAGLVLVDQTDERCDLYFSGAAMKQQRMMVRIMGPAARLGLLKFMYKPWTKTMPADVGADLVAQAGSVAGARGMHEELLPFADDLPVLRAAHPVLPPVPATWITGTKIGRMGGKVRRSLAAAHRASAAAHPGGRHVEATKSGHVVMATEPQLVVDEVLRVVDAAR